jgi:hypothetical protein
VQRHLKRAPRLAETAWAGLSALLLALCAVRPAGAQGAALVDVRVGEHSDYTRVVLDLDAEAELESGAREAGSREFVATLRASSALPIRRSADALVALVETEPAGSETRIRIRLRPGVALQRAPYRLDDPPRWVLDFAFVGDELATPGRELAAEPRAAEPELAPGVPDPDELPLVPSAQQPPQIARAEVAAETPPEAAPSSSRFRRPGAAATPQPAIEGRSSDAESVAIQAERAKVPLPAYDFVAVPDRWRIVENLGVNERFIDPYHQSTLKGDRPIFGSRDWFVNLSAISDTVVEPRRLPTPVGLQAERKAGRNGIFGPGEQLLVVQNLILSASLIQGNTVFRPPDWEFRFTGAGNLNYAEVETRGLLKADPAKGTTRTDGFFGLQEAFIDRHLRNKSDRYDFDSLRVGVQPFVSDFRGFLFQDNQLGARLFGNFSNNRLQYNLAYFQRLEKDTNSGLNEFDDIRDDGVVFANLYYQDFPVLGFTSQVLVAYNWNREGDDRHFNANEFLERPAPVGDERGHDYDVAYLGLNGDGHIDRLNLTYSLYYAAGHDDRNPIAARGTQISAWFSAVEASYDIDWMRFKLFGLFASGDDDPGDDLATGFDAIFENPNFAGADTSFFQRQAIPLIFGGGVVLSSRNALLPSLRTSKEEGQSNFVNPGLGLVGVGADFDILPELRLIANASWLAFHETDTLALLRNQARIGHAIGWDLSGGLIYRPLFIQNVVFRASGAVLLPGQGLRELYGHRSSPFYSALLNLTLTY